MKPCTGSIRVIAMSLVALATVVPARADSQATLVEEVRQATARFRDVAAAGEAAMPRFWDA